MSTCSSPRTDRTWFACGHLNAGRRNEDGSCAMPTTGPTPCPHYGSSAVATDPSGIISGWECNDCAYVRPFTSDDYIFTAQPYYPPKPAGATLAWRFMSQIDQMSYYYADARV